MESNFMFSVRLTHILRRMGITSSKQLVGVSLDKFYAEKHFGVATMRELKAYLISNNIPFKDEQNTLCYSCQKKIQKLFRFKTEIK